MPIEFDRSEVQRLSSRWRTDDAVGLISLQALTSAYYLLTDQYPTVWERYKQVIANRPPAEDKGDKSIAATSAVKEVLRKSLYPDLSPLQRGPVSSGFTTLLSQLAREDVRRSESAELDAAWSMIESGDMNSEIVRIMRDSLPEVWQREVASLKRPFGLRQDYYSDSLVMYRCLASSRLLGHRSENVGWVLVAFLQMERAARIVEGHHD